MTGQEFAEFIERQNWTKDQAAGILGVDQSTITRLKKRREIPGPIARLCYLIELHPACAKSLNHFQPTTQYDHARSRPE